LPKTKARQAHSRGQSTGRSVKSRGGVFWVVSAVLQVSLPAPLAGAQQGEPTDESEACLIAAERAQPLMRQKRLREARAELEMCARDVCPRIARTDCRSWLADVVSEQPSIVIAAHEVRGTEVHDVHGVRAIIDGAIAADNVDATRVIVDPGPHRLHLERAGADALEQEIDVHEGDKDRVVHVYWRAPAAAGVPRQGIPPALAVTAVAGAAAVGAGAYLEIAGLVRRGELGSSCQTTRTCSQSQVDAARNLTRAGDITIGAGLLVLACAAYLYFSRPPAAAPVRTDYLTWTLGPVVGGIAGGVEGRW
jgi:hypothetical protein